MNQFSGYPMNMQPDIFAMMNMQNNQDQMLQYLMSQDKNANQMNFNNNLLYRMHQNLKGIIKLK